MQVQVKFSFCFQVEKEMEITDQHDSQITFQFRFWLQISHSSGWAWDDMKITRMETKILSDSEFWPLQNWMRYDRNRISHSKKVSMALNICLLCLLCPEVCGLPEVSAALNCLFYTVATNNIAPYHVRVLQHFVPFLVSRRVITIWKEKNKIKSAWSKAAQMVL